MSGLREIHNTGCRFTWKNNRVDGFIEEKLDRIVANDAWCSLFPMATSKNLIWDGSDHTPILLSIFGDFEEDQRDYNEGPKLFRFEARWLHHEDFDSYVSNFWKAANSRHYGQWSKVVEECGSQLKKWN